LIPKLLTLFFLHLFVSVLDMFKPKGFGNFGNKLSIRVPASGLDQEPDPQELGTASFQTSRIRPLLFVRTRTRVRILPSTSKKIKKNLDFYNFLTLFFWHLESH
jgi:hypothetical protein